MISRDQVKKADKLLHEFCLAFLQLYGPQHCNMNMHLHLHLAECLLDYGPVYAFWCFSFERMNGVLGSYHTNNRNISVQLAKRFLDSRVYSPINWPAEFTDEYYPVIECFLYKKGSLMQRTVETEFFGNTLNITALPPIKEVSFSSFEIDSLKAGLDGVIDFNAYSILLIHKRVKALLVGGFVVGAKGSHNSRSSLVLARHTTSTHSCQNHLAEILYFVSSVAVSTDRKLTHKLQLNGLWNTNVRCGLAPRLKSGVLHAIQVFFHTSF